jgi:hypothetical protein
MGMFYSAYLAYGVRVPDTDPDRLEEALKGQPEGSDVGYLTAGNYDDDMTFLVTECTSADLGSVETVTPQQATPEQYAAWDAQLRAAATELGVKPLSEPGWLLIPDLD